MIGEYNKISICYDDHVRSEPDVVFLYFFVIPCERKNGHGGRMCVCKSYVCNRDHRRCGGSYPLAGGICHMAVLDKVLG